jgi:hypothetical protein
MVDIFAKNFESRKIFLVRNKIPCDFLGSSQGSQLGCMINLLNSVSRTIQL